MVSPEGPAWSYDCDTDMRADHTTTNSVLMIRARLWEHTRTDLYVVSLEGLVDIVACQAQTLRMPGKLCCILYRGLCQLLTSCRPRNGVERLAKDPSPGT